MVLLLVVSLEVANATNSEKRIIVHSQFLFSSIRTVTEMLFIFIRSFCFVFCFGLFLFCITPNQAFSLFFALLRWFCLGLLAYFFVQSAHPFMSLFRHLWSVYVRACLCKSNLIV